MATWGDQTCQRFEATAVGFETGFSRLRVRHSNWYAIVPHFIHLVFFYHFVHFKAKRNVIVANTRTLLCLLNQQDLAMPATPIQGPCYACGTNSRCTSNTRTLLRLLNQQSVYVQYKDLAPPAEPTGPCYACYANTRTLLRLLNQQSVYVQYKNLAPPAEPTGPCYACYANTRTLLCLLNQQSVYVQYKNLAPPAEPTVGVRPIQGPCSAC